MNVGSGVWASGWVLNKGWGLRVDRGMRICGAVGVEVGNRIYRRGLRLEVGVRG